MKFILFLFIILSINTCKVQEKNLNIHEKDYSQLKYIYSDLVEAFKAKDDQVLKEFCYQLAPDEVTFNYMRENNLCYNGIPCEMDEKGIDIKTIGDAYYPKLLEIKNTLKHSRLLDSLIHIDSTTYFWDVVVIVNTKKEGSNISTYYSDYSISQKEYDNVKSKAESNGHTFEEMILRGKEGDVYIMKGTEMPISLKSKNKSIIYSIGEMVLINNKWSLFTKPENSYKVKDF